MKNLKQEKLRRMQCQYHRHHPWCLQKGGLYIPHSYETKQLNDLSWWDDVGFILNKRRVIVWWQHPRCVYSDAIDKLSRSEVGDYPQKDLFIDKKKNYKKVGASRKRIVSYTCMEPSSEEKLYFERLSNIRERISTEGIDLEVYPSWGQENLNWAVGVNLVAPAEVRNEDELAVVASLARRLMLRQTTLDSEFPDYRYGKPDWLKEQNQIQPN
jgi:hypothetical protein